MKFGMVVHHGPPDVLAIKVCQNLEIQDGKFIVEVS